MPKYSGRAGDFGLYLVRHGVTQGNLDGIYMGSGTDQPLCAQGAAQLRALAARFPYPKAETVFSSPMRRAVETVELLFPDAKDKIILADLRENAFGEIEGRKVTELVQDAHFKQWMDPELWRADSGCGYLLQCSPELWMRDGIVEVSDIIPFGYLDEEEGK